MKLTDWEKLQRYGDKCEQHLKRVWLSHLLAMKAVDYGTVRTDPSHAGLMDEAFGQPHERNRRKLRSAFGELHLSALKAEYELHLKLICKALNVPAEYKNGRDLKNLIAKHTGVDVDDFLSPQIRVAFALRNLIEHCDCKVDAKFAKQFGQYWPQSSWGRGPIPPVGAKVPIADEDLVATYEALLQGRRKLTEKLLSVSRGARPVQSSLGYMDKQIPWLHRTPNSKTRSLDDMVRFFKKLTGWRSGPGRVRLRSASKRGL